MKKVLKNVNVFILLICASLFSAVTFAIADKNIGEVAIQVTDSLAGVVTLIIALATVAGIGFGVAAIFKFKQHKDNPTQVTLGQPLTLLALGVMLLWIQYLLQASGRTLAGDDVTNQDAQSKIGKDAPTWIKQ